MFFSLLRKFLCALNLNCEPGGGVHQQCARIQGDSPPCNQWHHRRYERTCRSWPLRCLLRFVFLVLFQILFLSRCVELHAATSPRHTPIQDYVSTSSMRSMSVHPKSPDARLTVDSLMMISHVGSELFAVSLLCFSSVSVELVLIMCLWTLALSVVSRLMCHVSLELLSRLQFPRMLALNASLTT